MRIGFRQPLAEANEEDIAKSIVKSSIVKPHRICFNYDDLSYLGTGFVLYFFYLRCLIGIALIITVLELYRIIFYFKGNYCEEMNNAGIDCSKDIITQFSIVNIKEENLEIYRMIWIFLTILITVLNFWMINHSKKVDRRIDTLEDSPSDYSVLLTGLPHDDNNDEILKALSKIKKKSQTVSKLRGLVNFLSRMDDVDDGAQNKASTSEFYEISKVSKVFKLTTFSEIHNKILNLRRKRAKFRVYVSKYQKNEQKKKAHDYMKKVLNLKRKIADAKQNLEFLKGWLHNKKYSAGMAFVSFRYKGDRDEFISRYESTFFNTYIIPTKGFQYKGKSIQVYEAPEPTDVLWNNLGQSIWFVIKRRVFTYVGSLMLIAISFFIVLSLKNFQKNIGKNNEKSQENATTTTEVNTDDMFSKEYLTLSLLSGSVSLTIVVVNKILEFAMKYFCTLEKHSSTTTFNLSYIHKLVRVQLFNTCGVVVISHLLLSEDKKNIWTNGGLIYDAGYFIIFKAFFTAPLMFFSLDWFLKLWKRKKLKKDPDNSLLLQYEANELYTGSKITPSLIFSAPLQIYYISLFYMPIFPLSSLLLLISITSIYYLEKYLFARRYSRPEEIDSKIGIDIVYRLGYGPIILYVSLNK